ncbi:hypothetical protein PVAP13_3KG358900 [Panicum virgatum]|uniref:Uncharacterized protein n=1 Tax=Panicum virgatum TaxID=38727 RepID=A0A8T0UWI2_PANVG|nr:hypothetical protein PVAP13_3KG358900 [Panicum virgatum]
MPVLPAPPRRRRSSALPAKEYQLRTKQGPPRAIREEMGNRGCLRSCAMLPSLLPVHEGRRSAAPNIRARACALLPCILLRPFSNTRPSPSLHHGCAMPGRSSREQRPYLAEAARSSGHTWPMGVTGLLHAPLIPNFSLD